ncbi:SubName: Full=Uncharacterized protein {ECO:0000313/EMBL:CCA75392.1} [Serendipita indica DSM 11827]|uniref:Uncharacterized protein n=1 Tax=Serendipita indica (strain DSM 11827) TaxID=1109443 RepID=G4TVP9_SERID|nr:SubName: Full=Uncharacterized protein {ECO:0000313/EMBL:CCA75392.1} [Serendipita indica DSM 11827]CCA75392.1 hypothetical protein PIIN_09375 [Serendipita indica DSM 11827]
MAPQDYARQYRSLPTIIWSCLITIFLCTWVSLHPNVPEPINTSSLGRCKKAKTHFLRVMSSRLAPFLVAFLAPEWVLAFSLRQLFSARYLAKQHGLALNQAFFIVMGGFHRFERRAEIAETHETLPTTNEAPIKVNSTQNQSLAFKDDEFPCHPLDRFDVIYLLNAGKLQMPRPNELEDRSKNDWVAKSLVLIQTTWFIGQCIGRKAQGLILTELEVITIAYSLVNVAIYIVWWEKPYQVMEPVRVYDELPALNEQQQKCRKNAENTSKLFKAFCYVLGAQDRFTDFRTLKRIPTFDAGGLDNESAHSESIMALIVTGVIFGSIHFLAWASSFPTSTERLLWHMSTIILVAVPLFPISFLILLAVIARLLNLPYEFAVAGSSLLPLAYIVGRITTITLAFTTLRCLPVEAYRDVGWSDFLPHI